MSNTAETQPPAQRVVIANLFAHLAPGPARSEAHDRFSAALERHVLPFADAAAARDAEAVPAAAERRIEVLDIDPAELADKLRLLPGRFVAEPVLLRAPALAYPAPLHATRPADTTAPGGGAQLALRVQNRRAEGVGKATVLVAFHRTVAPFESVTAGALSDGAGNVALPYDPDAWRPAFVAVEPAGGYWTLLGATPRPGQTLVLRDLEGTGPTNWWHMLCGIDGDENAGRDVRIGVVDTGIGPHTALDHVLGLGLVSDGKFTPGAHGALDFQSHGTHVSGIIGARDVGVAGMPVGLAIAADLMMVRIFGGAGGGSQADVACAVDLLSRDHGADIINLSLTGTASAIEHDAIKAAYQRGSVCVCAAGNQNGAPVGAPASYPSIAVSALGLLNTAPPDSMSAFNMPQALPHFTPGGLFLASFSNIGDRLFCTAPGNGIVSTIPARGDDPAPYVDMCGTSMAAPMAAAVLARLLAADPAHMASARDANRAAAARARLAAHCRGVGLRPDLQGLGLARGTG